MDDDAKILIENEDIAWRVFGDLVDRRIVVDEHTTLEFKGWPSIEFRIEGRRWKRSVPTRIMPPILDLQRDLYRAYARVRYGTPDIRKLTDEERETLEIVVTVDDGSSEFYALLEQALNSLVNGALSKMGPTELIVTILGLALVFAGRLAWKDWLDTRAKEREIQSRVQLSAEETKRLELMAKAMRTQPLLEEAKIEADDTRNRLVRSLDPPDQLHVADVDLPGNEAATLSYKPRERSAPIRIDGVFRIIGVNAADPTQFRLHVRNTDDGQELHVNAREEVLTHDMRVALQKGEWERRPVRFSINAKELRQQITSADVVSAELVRSE